MLMFNCVFAADLLIYYLSCQCQSLFIYLFCLSCWCFIVCLRCLVSESLFLFRCNLLLASHSI